MKEGNNGDVGDDRMYHCYFWLLLFVFHFTILASCKWQAVQLIEL